MQIISTPDTMIAVVDDLTIRWRKGTHTANVFQGEEKDVFTFAWDKNETSMLDFTSALQSYLEYVDEAN